MSQKLTNDQLREAYFKNHTTLNPFDMRQDSTNDAKNLSTKIEPTKVSYVKFNDKEINRFANLFNTFINSDPKSSIINLEHSDQYVDSAPELSEAQTRPSHYHGSYNDLFNLSTPEETRPPYYHGSYNDLFNLSTPEEIRPVENNSDITEISRLENDLRAQMQAQEELIRGMKAQLELAESLAAELKTPAPTEYVLTDEDDFYPESIRDGRSTSTQNSLADIFAEITSNEKDSVSNYEPSIFDANVEQLFAEGENIDKEASFTEPQIPTLTPVSDVVVPELNSFPDLGVNSPAPVLDTAIPELTQVPDLTADTLAPVLDTAITELTPFPDLSFTDTPAPNLELPELPDLNFDIPTISESNLGLSPMPVLNFEQITPVPETPSFDLPDLPEIKLEPQLPTFDLPMVPTLEPLLSDFELPLPVASAEATIPVFELPPLPELDFLKETPLSTPKLIKTKKNSEAIETSEQKKKQQEKSLKLKILDSLLIIVLLAIVVVFVFHFLY